jgi:hypothetical protein
MTSAATLERNEQRGDVEALLAARQAAQATEADRGRTVLLAAVSHDLRAPLAAAKTAVGGLRMHGDLLTAEDREELLSAAEESLDLLAHLAARRPSTVSSVPAWRSSPRGSWAGSPRCTPRAALCSVPVTGGNAR